MDHAAGEVVHGIAQSAVLPVDEQQTPVVLENVLSVHVVVTGHRRSLPRLEPREHGGCLRRERRVGRCIEL